MVWSGAPWGKLLSLREAPQPRTTAVRDGWLLWGMEEPADYQPSQKLRLTSRLAVLCRGVDAGRECCVVGTGTAREG